MLGRGCMIFTYLITNMTYVLTEYCCPCFFYYFSHSLKYQALPLDHMIVSDHLRHLLLRCFQDKLNRQKKVSL